MGKRIKCRGLILKQLPAEIIEEILLKLPLNSILRFKCVSKSWRCSISSKGFIREHLKKSNTALDFAHHNLIFTFNPTHPGIDSHGVVSCCIGSLLNDTDDGPHPNRLRCNLSIPIPVPDSAYFDVLGSCNGLILLRTNFMRLYSWNPSTRKAKEIIHPRETTRLLWDYRFVFRYALGYIESTDDYKVACTIFSSESSPHRRMYVYSSRTDSWKKILTAGRCNFSAEFVNGRLYCLRNKYEASGTIRWEILSFDLVAEEEERYQIMPPPPCLAELDDDPVVILGDLGGYLSLICWNHTRSITKSVWVLKNESWSKIWSFSCQIPNMLWLKKNGDILVAQKSDLVIYRENRKLRRFRVDRLNSDFESPVYVESLVSPFGDDEQFHQ